MSKYYACVCATDKTSGKVLRRTEKSGAFHDEYTYAYDEAGHLTEVMRNDLLAESYTYNEAGQRVLKLTGWADGAVRYRYDERGCLLAAGAKLFSYDEQGNLAFWRDISEYHSPKETRYFYHDTLLKGVVLPDGTELVYVHDERGNNPLCPAAKYKNGKPVMEYFWKDIRHLEACVDIARGIRFDFTYAKGKLSSIRLSRAGFVNGADILSRLGGGGTLLVFCDQVGTPRLFTNKAGRHIKELGYDSFGILEDDTLPELFVPVGFAGGLVDEDTGLVRFGFRDYDPNVGRFTCPDPLGDTGGDHDLYDYCVDDPVSMWDPKGLMGSHPKNTIKKGLEKYSPLLFKDKNDPAREEYREAVNLMLEGKVRGLGDGLQDMLQINDKMPPGSWIFPGASEDLWDEAKQRWQESRESYQQRVRNHDK